MTREELDQLAAEEALEHDGDCCDPDDLLLEDLTTRLAVGPVVRSL